jgi:hypothetical protein
VALDHRRLQRDLHSGKPEPHLRRTDAGLARHDAAAEHWFSIESKFTRAVGNVRGRFEYRLFLSATPHNGHSNSFSTLLELLDPHRFTPIHAWRQGAGSGRGVVGGFSSACFHPSKRSASAWRGTARPSNGNGMSTHAPLPVPVSLRSAEVPLPTSGWRKGSWVEYPSSAVTWTSYLRRARCGESGALAASGAAVPRRPSRKSANESHARQFAFAVLAASEMLSEIRNHEYRGCGATPEVASVDGRGEVSAGQAVCRRQHDNAARQVTTNE